MLRVPHAEERRGGEQERVREREGGDSERKKQKSIEKWKYREEMERK